MFYIIKEETCSGGGGGMVFDPIKIYTDYSLSASTPSRKDDYVTIKKTKAELKEVVKAKGSLDSALEYLWYVATDEQEIDRAFAIKEL